MEDLKQFLLGITSHFDGLVCVVETSHGLLVPFLLEAGTPVCPKQRVPCAKQQEPRTDQIDAYLLAKTGRFDLADLHRLEPDSTTVEELKTLTRDQDALVQMQTRLLNQLTARLFEAGTFLIGPDSIARKRV